MCLLDRGIILVNLNSDSGPVDLDSDGSGPTDADLTGVNPADSCVMSSSPASLGPTDIGVTDQELPTLTQRVLIRVRLAQSQRTAVQLISASLVLV